MTFFRGSRVMKFDDFSLRRADNVLQELYSRSDSGGMQQDTIEAAAILFDYFISHLQESYYRPHLENLQHQILSSLEEDSIKSLSYDALAAISRVLKKMKELFPESMPADIDEKIKITHTYLARHFVTVGDEEKVKVHLKQAEHENLSSAFKSMQLEIDTPGYDPVIGLVSVPSPYNP